MKIDKAILATGLSVPQSFFLGCWYNMSHEFSLDSDRASFVNPINGLNEMLALYSLGNNYGAAGKRVIVAAELSDIIENDLVLCGEKYLPLSSRINFYLKEEAGNSKPEHCKVNRHSELVCSLAKELLHLLKMSYLEDSLTLLSSEIINFDQVQKDDYFNRIIRLTNSIIGALASIGSGQPEAHALYRFILLKNPERSFDERFEQLTNTVLKPDELYKLTFTLDSKALVKMIVAAGGTIKFGKFNIQSISDRKLRATSELLAASFTIAGTNAYNLLEEFVDAISYTLGKQEITIETTYTSMAVASQQTKTFKVHKPIPNPNYEFNNEKFVQFCAGIEPLEGSVNQGIKDNKISAAFRLLRVGMQATSTESKFTSYWTALESLTRDVFVEKTGDDGKVIAATLPCIGIDYVTKKLKSFIIAFHQVGKVDFTVGDDVFSIQDAKPTEFYQCIMDAEKSEVLINAIAEYPYFQYKLKLFLRYFQSSISMYHAIISHETKVKRQIHRIYRVRNLVVHDAAKIDGLELLCANLEHYLKGCLNTMIEIMGSKPTIITPKEFYIRYADLVNEVKSELNPGFRKKKEEDKYISEGYNKSTKLYKLIELHQ
jgi:hypothetical protein